jgi:hypothetical protein
MQLANAAICPGEISAGADACSINDSKAGQGAVLTAESALAAGGCHRQEAERIPSANAKAVSGCKNADFGFGELASIGDSRKYFLRWAAV